MTARQHHRVAVFAYILSLTILLGYLCLLFVVPLFYDLEKQSHSPRTWVLQLGRLGPVADNRWIGFGVFSLFVLTATWGLLARARVRRMSSVRGFPVEPASVRE